MRRHNRMLHRAARSILRDDAEAEECLQSAYLLAYQSIGAAGDCAAAPSVSHKGFRYRQGPLRRARQQDSGITEPEGCSQRDDSPDWSRETARRLTSAGFRRQMEREDPRVWFDTPNGLLLAHGGHHLEQIQQLRGKQYVQEAQTWEAMKKHMHVIADALAGAIAKRFPNRFQPRDSAIQQTGKRMSVTDDTALVRAALSSALVPIFRGKFCDILLPNRHATTFGENELICELGAKPS